MTPREKSFQIPGYRLGSLLWHSGERISCIAQREKDGATLVVETLDMDYPGRKQVAELRREGRLCQQLSNIKGVRKVHELVPHGSGNLALIADPYEASLHSQLLQARGNGLPLKDVLNTALQLTQILGQIHRKDIVHKAITAENVLINPASGEVALAGFGIASELDQEPQATQMSRLPQGELPYMSPEQTGRMNRDLDYRSDYYSFGVLLFELVTGVRPFKANSLLEWVHCHIGQLPRSPHELNPNIPEALSNIILKLLAKSPEQRYHSAEGLGHDLKHCADALSAENATYLPVLGQKDLAHKFLLPQGLYGREAELSKLLGLFEDAAAGHTQFCLVHGYSGVGKTALVNELDKYQVRRRGFLVQGKFDQYHQGDTYSTLARTFQGLIQQLLLEPEEKLANWRQKLQSALAPNAALVIDLVPELALIIGAQPEVAELPPAEAKNRLHIVLTAFVRVFAGEGHPVVLFLDDLQWCDVPTLELLRRIVCSKEQSHLLLIGAYRSNEVPAGHPLQLMLDEVSSQSNIVQLPVKPLDPESVAHLVADGLCRSVEEIQPLSELLYQKAQGNPFFTNELLRHLHKVGAITPNLESDSWNWDLTKADWSSVSNDVVAFMVSSLRRLASETQTLLQLAACIDNRFDLKTLAQIYNKPIAETAQALLPALKQCTIRPLHNDYRLVDDKSEQLDFDTSYSFQHDRVQQAAYRLIDKEKLKSVHLSIGRLMLQQHADEVPDDDVIDIVGHLNAGRQLIEDPAELKELANLNLRAGQRARKTSAYEAALGYLKLAEELAGPNAWRAEPILMQKLASETQLCNYLTGRTSEADQWAQKLLEHANTPLEKSDILAIRTRQYATLGRMKESVQAAIQGLALLGIEFPEEPTRADIARERAQVIQNLGDRQIEDLVNEPLEQDPETLTAMRLFMEVFAAAFLSGSGNLFPYLVLKSVNLSLRSGICPESAFNYAAYGMILCGELDDPALGYQYGKVGLAINEKLGDLTLRARVIYVYAMFIHHWSEHWSSLTPWFKKGIEAGYQTGDLLYLAYSAQDCVIWDPRLDLETAHRLHAENLDIVRECAYQDSLDSGTLFLQLQRNLLGLTHSPTSLNDDSFDERSCLAGMQQRQFQTGLANYHIYSAEACYLHGVFGKALTHVQEQDKLIKSAMSLPQLTRFYLIANLTLSHHYPSMNPKQQSQTLVRLEQDLERMTRWANNCEENFRHLQYLMNAELERLQGQAQKALSLYDLAIDTAKEHGFLRDEAIACERAARLLIALKKRRSAEGYLRGAHHIYDRWGAHTKVTLLEQEFSSFHQLFSGVQKSHTWNSDTEIDLASVLKASRAISGEIVLDRLLDKTMGILLENAGAQWGCMAVRQQGSLKVEAAILPTPLPENKGLPKHTLASFADTGTIPLPVTLITKVLHHGQAIVLHQASTDSDFKLDPYICHFHPQSILCVPIKRERFEGVVYLENNLSSGVFSEARVETIRLLAAQASVAIENARLYEQVQEYSRTLEHKVAERTTQLEKLNHELQSLANRDSLTGVANRRRGDNYLEQVWLMLRREKQPLTVIMLDVDHFKAYNDTYGHQAGDNCLVQVTKAIQAELRRPADLIARYGGEEFILILPNTNEEGALSIGENVRSAVESLGIEHSRSSARNRVTISAGAATCIPTKEMTAESLVHRADNTLYQAKQQGRNRILMSAERTLAQSMESELALAPSLLREANQK